MRQRAGMRRHARVRRFWPTTRLGPAVGPARWASLRFGLFTVLVPAIGRPDQPPFASGGGVPVGRRQRVGPHRPEFAQPLFSGWLAAIDIGALVRGPSAEYHLCRHSPTRTTASPDPQRAGSYANRARPRRSLKPGAGLPEAWPRTSPPANHRMHA
jgi:hypothetical protein